MSGLAYDFPDDEFEEPGPSSGAVEVNNAANHARHSASFHPNGQPNWAPGPSPNDPNDLTADDFYAPPQNANLRHPNHSYPSLPSDRPPDYDAVYEHVAPLPSIHRDTSALVGSMNSMRISDPVPRGVSAMSFSSDPMPRAGTSMSMQSPVYRGPPQPRYANGLPPAPNATLPLHLRRPVDPTYDAGAVYHQGQGQPHGGGGPSPSRSNTGYPEGGEPPQQGFEADIVSMYTYDDQESAPPSAHPSSESSSFSYSQHPPVPQHYPTRQFQAGWQGPQHNPVPNYGQPHPGPARPGEYDYLYAAASDVLGMAPPPQAQINPYLPPSQAPLQASQSVPYLPPPGPAPYHPGPPRPPGPATYSPNATLPQGFDDPEFEMRAPDASMQRSATAASVNLSTRKTKAVDLTAPPYTKEYIDQYRQRIKADPDPEAHFLYAKYLIEAAKKVGADARDQRAVKKYRDLLIQESLKTIRRLATQNEAYDEAQFFLANCHGTGALGLQVDHERAYHLYLQGAKQNHAAAAYRVAVCNEIGAGTRRDPARASAFYRKAASLGDTAAMYKLGMILLLGSLGEQKNPREAINWLKRAAEQADEENPHALHELAMLHEMPNAQLVVHDPAYAKQLYTQAAHLGYTQSQFKLGQCFEYGALTCPVDPRRSIAWYTKAAEKGNSEAELALSGWYLTGSDGVLKQSDSEAYLWARKAANKGLSKAEYAVGYYAEVGIGIKQDLDFAKRWYMRAAAQGNKRAMNRLTEIKRMGNKRSNVGRPTRQQAKDECVIC